MTTNPFQAALAMADELTRWRRTMHAHPELSGKEEWTSGYVAGLLRGFGYADVRERVGGGWGVTAELRAPGAKRTVALRADMDALPIAEETGVEYASSNPGVMHACGHDAHTAMLLGAAKLLPAFVDRLGVNVRLLFQPHEEVYPGGAPEMIAAGALDDVDSIFGLHIFSELPYGMLGVRAGSFMAAVNGLEIVVNGAGGHAAMPDACVDPIVIASEIVVALQTVISRNIGPADSAVVSVTQFHAGTADNVIPDRVLLRGTIRTFDARIQERVISRVRALATGIASAHGGSAEVRCGPGYPVLKNDADLVAKLPGIAEGVEGLRVVELPPLGGGEDFAYYTEKRPGLFAFLGARNESTGCRYPHHHAKFNIDERALPQGAALHVHYCLRAGA